MNKYIITLVKDEHEALSILISKGKHKSQKIFNALILLGCDEGKSHVWFCAGAYSNLGAINPLGGTL